MNKMIRKQKTIYEYNLELVSEKFVILKCLCHPGKITNRKIFKIKTEDIGKQTVSLGRLTKFHVGRYYVIDNDKIDYIVDEINKV